MVRYWQYTKQFKVAVASGGGAGRTGDDKEIKRITEEGRNKQI